MKQLIVSALFLFALVAQPQDRDLAGKVAFVSLTTVQEPAPGAGGQHLVRNVLLRLTQMGTQNAFLAVTDDQGSAIVPLEAGTWCVQPYGLDGHPAKLSLRTIQASHRCFTAAPGSMTQFGVTLAWDDRLSGAMPGFALR